MTELLERTAERRDGPGGDLRERALRRLSKKRELRAHLLAYVLVNAFLWLIWGVVFLSSGFWFPWPLFPLVGWGIGVVFHVWDVYGNGPFTEAAIAREIDRLAHDRERSTR